MSATADLKHAESLAHEIAEVLTAAGLDADVLLDADLGSYAVAVDHFGSSYLLAMPAPGALYALFRDGAWLGGMECASSTPPRQVASALIRRVLAVMTGR